MTGWRSKREQVVLNTSQGPFPVPVRFTRRRGFRHLRVSIDLYNEVVVNVPLNIAERQARLFLQQQADWIYDVLSRSPERILLADYIAHRPTLSGAGEQWKVEVSSACQGGFEIDTVERVVRIHCSPLADANTQILTAIRGFAAEVIPDRVGQLAKSIDVRYRRISVRDQRTRWGSCSERGTLSFNWRMVLLPLCLHDYLIWHELAHLTHLNHSARYWRLLGSYDSDYSENDAALTQWSALLMRLGRQPPVSAPLLDGTHG